MFEYYLVNILLTVLGGVFFIFGGGCTWVSMGSYKAAKDWFGIILGIICMVIAIGFWWVGGGWYP